MPAQPPPPGPVSDDGPAWAAASDAPSAEEILALLGDVVVVVSPDLRVAAVNDAAAALLGEEPGEVVGRSALDVVHPGDLEEAADLLTRFHGGREMARPSIRLDRDGEPTLAVELVARRVERPGGTWIVFSGRVEPTLNTEDLMDSVGVGIVLFDEAGGVTESNLTAAELLGGDPGSLGLDLTQLAGRLRLLDRPDAAESTGRAPSDSGPPHSEPAAALLDGSTVVRRRVDVEGPHGSRRVIDAEVRPVRMRYSGRSVALLTMRDVTAEHAAEVALLERATTDDLTGLASRSEFMAQVDSAISAGPVGVLFCDLDRFKSINERFGHGEADRLLQVFARELVAALPPTATVGRLGGDEFAAAVPVRHDHDLDDHAESVRQAARRAGLSSLHLTTTVSVGTSWTGPDPRPAGEQSAPTAATLVEEADEALRRAKRTGRDRAAHFDTDMRAWRAEQTAMAAAVREHLEAGRVEIAVQPVVDPRTGRVSGGEALARIRDADGELVPAALWIEAATRTGLIGAVDAQVLDRTAALIAALHRRHREQGRPDVALPVIGVNLSDSTLARADLDDWLLAVLGSHGAPLDHLVIEIPETVFPVIRDRSADALRRLKDQGAWVAIDDFGVGYASLAEVRDLPIDTLKIDRSFVVAEPGTTHEAILRASLEMARALDCRSVAEGVETERQLALLVDLGVDYVQGYLTGRPLDPEAFAAHAGTHWSPVTTPRRAP